jgi:two-component system sensor histidine kinase DegS
MKSGLLRISIVDEGKGFDPQSKEFSASTGLSGMQERVQLAGGRFALKSAPEKGTLVLAEFDIEFSE